MTKADDAESGDVVASASSADRHWERRAFAGLAVVVVVAAAVAALKVLGDDDDRRTPRSAGATPTAESPPTRSTASPSWTPEAVRRPWDVLPVGEPTDVPFAVGSRMFAGSADFTLRTEGSIGEVHAINGGYLVRVNHRGSAPDSVGVVRDHRYRELVSGYVGGLAVDREAGRAAWGVRIRLGSRTRLMTVNLGAGDSVAEQVIEGPWMVVGYAEGRVVIEPLLHPGGPPRVWDPATESVTEMRLPWSPYPGARPLTMQPGGGLLLFHAYGDRCETAVLTSDPQTPIWDRCDTESTFAAVSRDGSQVAVVEDVVRRPAVGVVLDAGTGETAHRWNMPRGVDVVGLTWEGADKVLFLVEDSYRGGNLASTLIRCTVGQHSCERVPTPDDAYISAVAQP